jgi:hypothetical protein
MQQIGNLLAMLAAGAAVFAALGALFFGSFWV